MEQRVYLASRSQSTSGETKAGALGRTVEVRTEAEPIEELYSLACLACTQHHLPSDGTALSGLGPSTSTANQENALKIRYRQFNDGIF